MSNITRIYLDFLSNLFSLLFLLRLTKQFLQRPTNRKIAIVLIIMQFIYSIPSYIPQADLFCLLLDFLIVVILCYPRKKQIFFIYTIYEFATNIIFTAIYLLHSTLLHDFQESAINHYYFQYKYIICISLIYIFYVLYTNSKRIRIFHTNFQHYFNLVIVLISLFLSYVTLYLCKMDTSNSYMIPVLFSFIYILIIICILIYEKFIDLLSENAKTKIQLEKSQLEQQYSIQIEDNLKSLSAIRHDMKNHLIVIHGYAMQNNCSSILKYIQKIFDNFLPTHFIQTSSDTISALLNAKYQEANRMHITCEFTLDFPSIHIEDYYLITILGNLIDNALTASGKRSDGFIRLKIMQVGSYLEILIENNHNEHIRVSHGSFLSTKKDANAFHGIGIKNVHSAVDFLNGHMDISYTNENFHISILVPNY